MNNPECTFISVTHQPKNASGLCACMCIFMINVLIVHDKGTAENINKRKPICERTFAHTDVIAQEDCKQLVGNFHADLSFGELFIFNFSKNNFSPKNSFSNTASLAGQISRTEKHIATGQRQGSHFTHAFFRVMFRFATSRIREYK